MNDKELKVEIIEEEYDEFDYIDMEKLLPSMNLSTEMIPHEEKESIIKDDSLLGLYGEILENCREDRSKADEILSNFLEMIINDGDASSASKEAIVNLLKIKQNYN